MNQLSKKTGRMTIMLSAVIGALVALAGDVGGEGLTGGWKGATLIVIVTSIVILALLGHGKD